MRTSTEGKDLSAAPSAAEATTQTGDATPTPLLDRLRLPPADLEALRHQGTVHIEHRGGKPIGKLRFHRGGKQVVRYLGGTEAARQVQEELLRSQALYRKSRQLRRLLAEARAVLKDCTQVTGRKKPCGTAAAGHDEKAFISQRPFRLQSGCDMPCRVS